MNNDEYSAWLASLTIGDCVGVREGPSSYSMSTVREFSPFSVVLIDGRLFSRRTGKFRGHNIRPGCDRAKLIPTDDWWLLQCLHRQRALSISYRVQSATSSATLDRIEEILAASRAATPDGQGE